jgi:hypothetical protein
MSDIKLTLTVDEVNRVLGALGERPFVQVIDLITKVRTQAQPQVPEQKTDMVADELVG